MVTESLLKKIQSKVVSVEPIKKCIDKKIEEMIDALS